MEFTTIIAGWLETRLSAQALAWLNGQRESLRENYTDRTLHITLGLIPRRVGKDDLALTDGELEAAANARSAWDPSRWSIADAARALVLLETASASNEPFEQRFKALCSTADVAEVIGLYRALPLYPEPQLLEPQAGEGLRSNMRTVFEAVAHYSPYPREVFREDRWNHMVLKALFVDSALDPIQGLDDRANPELARIMCDYAHERWAAGRAVSPELWRCVGPFAEGPMLDDLARAAASDDENESRAAILALQKNDSQRARDICETRPEINAAAKAGEFTWHDIAAACS